MIKIAVPLSFAALLFLGACETPQAGPQAAAAVPASQTAASSSSAQADDGDEMVCTTEAVIGSRMGRRVCMTRSERERVREESREATDDLQRSPIAGPDNVGGGG